MIGLFDMGGISKPERATWRIANLTTRDLNGQGSRPPGSTKMPGKDIKGWLGEVQEG
jgi:hypothetical protein